MRKVWKSYKKESRVDWGRDVEPNTTVCDNQLKLGALLRIADSLEIMTREKRSIIAHYEHRIAGRDWQPYSRATSKE